ncbi:hypothetical protein RUM44_003754 [Polyplax serrata]|uniref:Uncharacterized protein n=1 Tax=Polyplax serrata TaxID=468196 RepID=A0ABR1AHZ6_POLSC
MSDLSVRDFGGVQMVTDETTEEKNEIFIYERKRARRFFERITWDNSMSHLCLTQSSSLNCEKEGEEK